nr:MAG: replication factor C large subunit [Candidatus Nanosalinarum sp. J07AB56]
MMWVKKYRPESLSDYRGASKEKEKLREWAEDWEKGDGPTLLHGQAGTGKTSLVEALANDLDMELVETNASDVRTKTKLREELLESVRQRSFLGKEKLILVDEVDGMSGNADRGGTSLIREIVEESRFPVVMTANDPYESKIKTLRQMSEMIELGSVHTNSIAAHLREILEEEGIEYEGGAPKRLARQADGQMRSAINDLEAVARGRNRVSVDDIEDASRRDDRKEVFDSLKIVFKTETPDNARQATENLDENPETWMQWVRENLPREYGKSQDIADGMDAVSGADLFNGRVRRTMNWSLMRYVYLYTTVGVALAKEERYSGWTNYQYPSKIRDMGKSNSSRKKRSEIGEKIGEKLHISISKSVSELFFLSQVLEENPGVGDQLGLTSEEVEFVKDF